MVLRRLTMGKFVIFEDGNGEWRFNLKAGNGEVIATSEGYKTKQGCEKGIASVQANAPYASIVIEEREISSEELKEEIIKKEDEYRDRSKPEIVKPKEEEEDEKKVVDPPAPNRGFHVGDPNLGPRWL